MSITICTRDESAGGTALNDHDSELELPEARTTLRALIEEHVRQDLRRPRKRGAAGASEGARAVDADAEIARVIDAWKRAQLLVLIGDEQVQNLDSRLVVRENAIVRFIRLVPLTGGRSEQVALG